MDFIGSINWQPIKARFNGGRYWDLTDEDIAGIKNLLRPNYYFILTRRKCHLTTYLISLAGIFTSGKPSYYTHALMNVDAGLGDFRFIESTSVGVHYSTLMEVLDCDSVALIQPKNVSPQDWVLILDKAASDNGKEYDDLFQATQDQYLSCVELCRDALKAIPDYAIKFANFEILISNQGNKVTPQMLYDCLDFEVALEIRR